MDLSTLGTTARPDFLKRASSTLVLSVALVGFGTGCGGSNGGAANATGSVRLPTQCPKSKFHKVLADENPRAASELFPTGAREVLLCGYRSEQSQSMHEATLGIAEKREKSMATIHELERVFDSLPIVSSGATTCESGSPRFYFLFVRYPDEPRVVVRVSYTECNTARNGVSRDTFDPKRTDIVLDRVLSE
jgi:hypothetical protein